MGMQLTLEHGEHRTVIEVGSTDEEILLMFSQKERLDMNLDAGYWPTTHAEAEEQKMHLTFYKLASRVLPIWYKNGRPSSAGELRAAAEQLLGWCDSQGEGMGYVYLANRRPLPGLDYNGFFKGIVTAVRINGELFELDTGLGLCELSRIILTGNGCGKVVERRDLRGEVARGMDRIATDNKDDIFLKRRKVAVKLPSILKAVAEFASRFPPEETVMVSYRDPPGKKRRKSEEEEEAEL